MFHNTAIADRIKAVSNYRHQTGVVNQFTDPTVPPPTTDVQSKYRIGSTGIWPVELKTRYYQGHRYLSEYLPLDSDALWNILFFMLTRSIISSEKWNFFRLSRSCCSFQIRWRSFIKGLIWKKLASFISWSNSVKSDGRHILPPLMKFRIKRNKSPSRSMNVCQLWSTGVSKGPLNIVPSMLSGNFRIVDREVVCTTFKLITAWSAIILASETLQKQSNLIRSYICVCQSDV